MTTGTSLLPRRWAARVQVLAAVVLALLAFGGAAAVKVHAAVSPVLPLTAVASSTRVPPAAPAPASPAGTFTLGDLAAGRVSQEEQDRFWQTQLDAILGAPCPTTSAGGTAVTLFVGADEAWSARLEAAHAEHRAACAA